MLRLISQYNTIFFTETFKRFPLPILMCITLCTALISKYTKVTEYSPTLIVLGVWFTALKLIFESLNLRTVYYYFASIVFGTAISIYLHTHSFALSSPLIPFLLALSGGLLIMTSPYITEHNDYDNVWAFQFKVILSGLKATFITVTLTASLFLLLFAVNYLFSISFYSKIYADILSITTTLIGPVIFFGLLPKEFDNALYALDGQFIQNTLKYLLIPFWGAYALILHIYAATITISGNVPKNKLGYLVFIFTLTSLFNYILLQRWRDNQYLQYIYKYSGYALIIPLIFMLTALNQRVMQYGFTEMRYIMIVFAFGALICTIIMLLRLKNPTPWIFGIYSALLFVISIYNLSPIHQTVYSQIRRLQEAASAKNHVEATKIIKFLDRKDALDLLVKEMNLNVQVPQKDSVVLSMKELKKNTTQHRQYLNNIYAELGIKQTASSIPFTFKTNSALHSVKGYRYIILTDNIYPIIDKKPVNVNVPGYGKLNILLQKNGDVQLFKDNSKKPFYTQPLGKHIKTFAQASKPKSPFPLIKFNTRLPLVLKLISIDGAIKNNTPEIRKVSFIIFVK